jgi:RimJ/RimL family protein N-acetyltransferase
MEKIGMRFEGRFRQTRFVKGRWIDLSYYAILEEEWWRLQRDSMRLNPENR